jgi:hypothetical protein
MTNFLTFNLYHACRELEGKYRVNWVLCFPLQVTIDYIILSLSHAHTIRQLPKGKEVLYLQDARPDSDQGRRRKQIGKGYNFGTKT